MKKITLFLSAIVLMSAVFTGCEDPGKETETELTVSTTSMLFDANNTAAQTFTVNATAAWTVATEANWIHVDPTTVIWAGYAHQRLSPFSPSVLSLYMLYGSSKSIVCAPLISGTHSGNVVLPFCVTTTCFVLLSHLTVT